MKLVTLGVLALAFVGFFIFFKARAPATGAAGPKAAPATFWSWFAQHEAEFAKATSQAELTAVVEQASAQIEKVCSGLVAEVEPRPLPERPRLVVSADGHREWFKCVEEVVAAAPPLQHWEVVAFRQRGHGTAEIRVAGGQFGLNDFFFRPVGRTGGKVDIEIQVRGLNPSNAGQLEEAAYVLLDDVLGERDTELKVGSIEVVALREPVSGVEPLSTLAKVVDAL